MAIFSKKPPKDQPRRRQLAGDVRRAESLERQQDGNTTFKRNRTLTGSASSNITSANESQADLRSPRTHAHHLALHRRKLSGVLVVIVFFAALCAGLLYQLTATITILTPDPALQLQTQRYQIAIDEYLTKHPVERLRFTLNNQRLTSFMQRTLPEVASIRDEGFAGFGASKFEIQVRKPIAGWLINTSQYFVDAQGVPFQLNYYPTPGLRIVDQSGIQQTAGTAIASSRFLNFVGRSVAYASERGMEVQEAIIPRATTRQVELKIAGHTYPVKLSLDRPIGEQVEDMQRAIVYFDSKKQSPAYIDVRVSGKAFYK
jgi:hypothetical protein